MHFRLCRQGFIMFCPPRQCITTGNFFWLAMLSCSSNICICRSIFLLPWLASTPHSPIATKLPWVASTTGSNYTISHHFHLPSLLTLISTGTNLPYKPGFRAMRSWSSNICICRSIFLLPWLASTPHSPIATKLPCVATLSFSFSRLALFRWKCPQLPQR
jgi:hypothetical protein